MIFKVEAEGDVLYIEADTQADAQKRFNEQIGEVPANLLTWSTVDAIPDGEELL